MKLGRILRESLEGAVPRLVVVQPEYERVIDLASAEYQRLLATGALAEAARRLASALYPGSMSAAIAAGPSFLTAATSTTGATESSSAVLPIGQVRWLTPIDPPVMRDCLAFEQHLRNTLPALATAMNVEPRIPDVYYEKPIYYKGNPLTLIGHEQEVSWPDYSRRMDYELELGFVIGRPGKDLTPEQAKAHLFGVTIFNDFSARDIQSIEMKGLLGPAKGKDFATALGPWITTVDELDVHNLTMVARVNGEEWSHGSSSTIMWRVEEIIAYISKAEGLVAGELIGSGTVGGGCGVELGKLLKAGDVVELEVEGIGILRNKMGTPAPSGWMPERRIPATQ
ncbi:MAG TPA: fumarylacetoacetate hydrolase family protein [Ktedonobacteraceae bacterium]|nr:fumarylacetoacetate hydrolase family protein [Ktedonobacteraceae bacterium]